MTRWGSSTRARLLDRVRVLREQLDHRQFLGSVETLQVGLGSRWPLQVRGRRLAEEAAHAGVRVLHVEDRVVGRLPLGQIEIELQVGIGAACQEEEPRTSGPTSSSSSSTVMYSARRVDIFT